MKAIHIALNLGSIVLVAVLGWLVVRIGLGISEPKSLYAAEPIAAPTALPDVGSTAAVYDFSSDPFSFGEVEIEVSEFIEDAPETTLDLKLKGIISESTATFEMPDGKDKAVGVGEDVMNGVTLTRTSKDFVTLDVNGESQKLTRESVKESEKKDVPLIARAAPKSNMPSREEVENLFRKLKLRPSQVRGPNGSMQMQGFKINARPGANLAQFNLKSGDILTRVGPIMLNTTTPNIKELVDMLASGAAQDFEVIRNGAPVTIRIGQ